MATLNLNISTRQALNVFILFLLLSVGCTRTKTEERLEEIDRLTETTPVAALDSLSKMKGIRMTEAELNRRRVLVTKARDKAYIRHKSADMIQEAVDYYSRRGSRNSAVRRSTMQDVSTATSVITPRLSVTSRKHSKFFLPPAIHMTLN